MHPSQNKDFQFRFAVVHSRRPMRTSGRTWHGKTVRRVMMLLLTAGVAGWLISGVRKAEDRALQATIEANIEAHSAEQPQIVLVD